MSNLTVFEFESKEVRFVGTALNPWWVAADVCAAIEINTTQTRRLDEDEKDLRSIQTLGGIQEMLCINESGFYSLVLGSRKPQAKRFKKWITSEVLPAIRKTGKYELPQAQPQLALPPSPQEIAEVIELTLSCAGLDPKLVAGVKLNAIAQLHPQYTLTAEAAKSALAIPVENALLTPTQIAEILSDRYPVDLTARQINQKLLDQGFQAKNPDGNPAYLPTNKGKEHGQIILNTAKGHDKTIQSLRWFKTVLEVLEVNDH